MPGIDILVKIWNGVCMGKLLFRDRYRIPSTRLKHWDYGKPAFYFVTICTDARYPFFGTISNHAMYMTVLGDIVHNNWSHIPEHFSNIHLNEFIVMPDHIHGVIVIDTVPEVETLQCNVSTRNTHVTDPHMSDISPKPGSLPTVIRSFKSACAYTIHKNHPYSGFAWQSRYHEHIIRNDDELLRIREYIRDNPKNYDVDP